MVEYIHMKQIKKALEKFGLSQNEIKIYLQALKLEKTSPYQLSRLTKIPRTTVYDTLMNLSLKGLIHMQQSDGIQTKIKALNPSKLRSIIHQKQEKLTDLDIDLVEIMPFLKGDYHKDQPNADFQFFPGIKGAKKVFFTEDQDQTNAQVYGFTKLLPIDIFGPEAIDDLIKSENKVNTPKKEIIQLNDWTKHVLSYQVGKNPAYLDSRQIRFIDNPIFKQFLRLAIKGSRVRITCAEGEEVWGLIINSKALSKSLLSIFHLIWSQATPVTEKLVKSWGTSKYLKQEQKRDEKSRFNHN